ncbi:MAG TPA: GDSL-type esterase/lipase family protein [Ignavibacteriaceae bacterium]|nr:GDSL-type esterase/lipase family protein [Ignavibacteriaceae bacterium]
MALNKQKRKEIISLASTHSVDELAFKYKVSKQEISNILKKTIKATDTSERKSPWWFYLILVIIPFIFVLILEISLRIFNYGDDYKQWVNISSNRLMLNNEIARRYFYTTKNIPYSIQNTFDVEKKENAFRVFVMGESSAAGYPYSPNGSFSRYIQKRLEVLYPDRTIEVVNIGLTAISSYTIRDLFPGVLEQKPDLVLIYTGHNEYYGALGVGSLESLGQSRFFVNLTLSLNQFRITQLMRNFLAGVITAFSSDNIKNESGTLMSRMAKEQLIEYDSNVFEAGVIQFRENIKDILLMAKEKNVPIILGTLTSNLKDQPPFNPEKINSSEDASAIFTNAEKLLSEGKNDEAKRLFILAKERDALRFRASYRINDEIKKLANEFNMHVADVDSAFNSNSAYGITGEDLMVDHLHPNLQGYQLMGNVFFQTMLRNNLIPLLPNNQLTEEYQHETSIKNFYFSQLDSTISKYRIIILKNDWPFSERKDVATMLKLFNPITPIDSLALYVIDNKLSWEEAHRKAANYYLSNKQFDNFLYEMNVLIDQYPFIIEYYDMVAEQLLVRRDYEQTYSLLKKKIKISEDAFATKWIGIIELSRHNYSAAINYLNRSISFNNRDAQVLFNLSGAYVGNQEPKLALTAIERCLQIEPNFPGAKELYNQISAVVKILE